MFVPWCDKTNSHTNIKKEQAILYVLFFRIYFSTYRVCVCVCVCVPLKGPTYHGPDPTKGC